MRMYTDILHNYEICPRNIIDALSHRYLPTACIHSKACNPLYPGDAKPWYYWPTLFSWQDDFSGVYLYVVDKVDE